MVFIKWTKSIYQSVNRLKILRWSFNSWPFRISPYFWRYKAYLRRRYAARWRRTTNKFHTFPRPTVQRIKPKNIYYYYYYYYWLVYKRACVAVQGRSSRGNSRNSSVNFLPCFSTDAAWHEAANASVDILRLAVAVSLRPSSQGDNFCNLFTCWSECLANVFVGLNFVTFLDFYSGQDFILEYS